jgi:CBS-domain-containing membrane protein
VALLGVLLGARPSFMVMPELAGSLLLLLIAVAFSRLILARTPDPHHWL